MSAGSEQIPARHVDQTHRVADAEDADRYIRLIAGANPPSPHDVELWLDTHTFPLG